MTPTPDNPVKLNLLFLGLTAILIGYFLIWLPGPSVGLQLIGIELGEWIKFLGVRARRDWFYLPPIVVGMSIALLAAMWSNGRPQTWLARVLAVAVAMLSFPAIAAIQLEPRSEWLARLLWIGLVVIVSSMGALISRRNTSPGWVWLVIAVVALVGSILPILQFFAIRSVVEGAIRQPVGVGLGVWLNVGGGLLVSWIAIDQFRQWRHIKKTATA